MSVKIKILGKSVSVESAREVWLELDQIFDFVPSRLPDFEYDDLDDLDLSDDNISWVKDGLPHPMTAYSSQSDSKAAMGLVTFAQSKGFTLEDDFWHSDTGIVSQAVMDEMYKDYLFEL